MSIIVDRRQLMVAAAGSGALALASEAKAVANPKLANETPAAEFIYESIVTLGAGQDVGMTPFGRRARVPITGGTFAGPKIKGTILSSGEDWQLIRPDGFTVIEASYWLRTDDGAIIHIVNKGVVGKGYGRTAPWFEAPSGPHQWMNEAIFVGTLGPVAGRQDAVKIRVFKVI